MRNLENPTFSTISHVWSTFTCEIHFQENGSLKSGTKIFKVGLHQLVKFTNLLSPSLTAGSYLQVPWNIGQICNTAYNVYYRFLFSLVRVVITRISKIDLYFILSNARPIRSLCRFRQRTKEKTNVVKVAKEHNILKIEIGWQPQRLTDTKETKPKCCSRKTLVGEAEKKAAVTLHVARAT